ncbi:MAG TPA: MFS transporter [Planctomycetota bacterium]|jgi:nucleoside transporter|nr:MFS transporter [Planctomycetota bacterium]OQC21031.1 MAG: putative nucleoside transporter YegT [Planctomycetes bacterium ADurb.Bin069]NMD36335.1 nucleoside permease [Planctomycetota bacterium]HNR99421.1 MFS transporter [Planctomycetota bacterium]HNU25961.1 MFS transporter [Planctomycetota bacterium]
MTETKAGWVYPRLQLAYLLQFAIWGSWAVALGGYLNGKMSGAHVGAIYMAIPWGAIIAPLFIGPIADRFFAAQKVLGLLHLISGGALVACGVVCAQAESAAAGGTVTVPFTPLMILMLISGICFMPSIPLVNTVVFKHLPDSASAPKVFIFGTIGWILVNLVVEVFAGGASSPTFFFIGGGCGLFMGLYSLTLPDTPPKGAATRGAKDAFGLGALALFKSPTFTVFLLCAFMVSVFGSNYFFPSVVAYLTEYGYPAPVALTTLNQFSELFFMAVLAFCVTRFGLKWVLVLGMSAWAVRYFIFTQEGFLFALIGLLFHGMAYAFLYAAAYIFGDRVAPAHLKASVQSLLAFLLLGIGQVLSGYFFGYQIDRSAPAITQTVTTEAAQVAKSLPAWNAPEMETSAWRYLDLAKSVKYLRGDKEVFSFGEHLGKYTKADGSLDMDKLPAVWESGGIAYTKDELKATFDKVGTPLTRDKYLQAQRHDWIKFFVPPAIFVCFWVLLFIIFGREPAKTQDEPARA